jgi:hypothetical protein
MKGKEGNRNRGTKERRYTDKGRRRKTERERKKGR